MKSKTQTWTANDLKCALARIAQKGKQPETSPRQAVDSVTVSIPFLLPGLNGKDGLIRQHYHSAAKVKAKVLALVRAGRYGTFGNARVKVICTRFYCGSAMDFDNAAASFKHLLDAIVKAGIIADDGPKTIDEWTLRQTKVEKRTLQKMQVEIIKF